MVHGHDADHRSDARRPPAPDHDLTPLDRDSLAADLLAEPEVVEMFDWPRRPTRWHLSLAIRELACGRYAWAVPCTEALTALRRLSPLVEIGAGTGYWARLLAGHGADVAAYDLAPPRPPAGGADLGRSIAEVLHTDPARFFPVTEATGVDVARAMPTGPSFSAGRRTATATATTPATLARSNRIPTAPVNRTMATRASRSSAPTAALVAESSLTSAKAKAATPGAGSSTTNWPPTGAGLRRWGYRSGPDFATRWWSTT